MVGRIGPSTPQIQVRDLEATLRDLPPLQSGVGHRLAEALTSYTGTECFLTWDRGINAFYIHIPGHTEDAVDHEVKSVRTHLLAKLDDFQVTDHLDHNSCAMTGVPVFLLPAYPHAEDRWGDDVSEWG